MLRNLGLPGILLIYGLVLPAALLVGYLLAIPTNRNLAVVGLSLLTLALPVLLRYHHFLLISVWNTTLIFFFLKGEPTLWLLCALVSLSISILTTILKPRERWVYDRSVSAALLSLAAVVVITMAATGGIGGRAFGSEMWGGKRYFTVLGAIIGYFAIAAKAIPLQSAKLHSNLFLLSGVTAIVSDMAYMLGPSFYILFLLFPAELAYHQALTQDTLHRMTGVAWAAESCYWWLLMRFGIRGIFQMSRPWRLFGFVLLVGLSLLGGFRSSLIIFLLLFATQFVLEGLFRSRLFPILLVSGLLGGVFLTVFVDRLPLSVQRSLSFLPLRVDASARQDANSTLEWRLEMWRIVVPEVPKHLLLGKGYSFSGADFYLTQEAVRRGMFTSFEDTLVSGNYHNGFLTLIIPFGIFGLLAFLWFGVAALRVLYRNFRDSPVELKTVNTFLLAFFISRMIFYWVFYGQFQLDLSLFVGLVAFSLSLNAGARRARTDEPEAIPSERSVLPEAQA